MSNRDMARRTDVQVCFAGVDISVPLRKHFLSLTYTDNEEDETDDIQIRIEDREGIWLTQWLDASLQESAPESNKEKYKVTAQSGLNIRSGPGIDFSTVGGFYYGTEIDVETIINGWAKILYSGKVSYVSADHITKVDDEEIGRISESTTKGLSIQAAIVRKNWNGDGIDRTLDCGAFELDSVDASGPPAVITIKGTSLPFRSQIRQTKKNKAWEAYTLSKIANEMASANNMTCMYESAIDPYYERVEQISKSDIALLSQLCHEAGISLKATNNIMVLFDQVEYEARPELITLTKGDGTYKSYKLMIGAADKEYASCRVSYIDPDTGNTIQGIAVVPGHKADNRNNQRLEIKARVANAGEAKEMAGKMLRLQNKHERTAIFTLPGNPDLIAGVNVILRGWGLWNGKYIISRAIHTVNADGYTTQIRMRHVLEGY